MLRSVRCVSVLGCRHCLGPSLTPGHICHTCRTPPCVSPPHAWSKPCGSLLTLGLGVTRLAQGPSLALLLFSHLWGARTGSGVQSTFSPSSTPAVSLLCAVARAPPPLLFQVLPTLPIVHLRAGTSPCHAAYTVQRQPSGCTPCCKTLEPSTAGVAAVVVWRVQERVHSSPAALCV